MATYLVGIYYSEHGRNTRKRQQPVLHSPYCSHSRKLNILVVFSLPSPCLKETDNSRTERKNGLRFKELKQTS
jgi:hypothetical protein